MRLTKTAMEGLTVRISLSQPGLSAVVSNDLIILDNEFVQLMMQK